MKKQRITLTAILLGLIFLVPACASATSGRETADKVLKIGVTGQSYPNTYKEAGELTGFDVEVAQSVAQLIGYEIRWVVTDFSGLIGQLDSGKIDTIANAVARTGEREQKFGFSIPYSYYGAQLTTGAQQADINGVEDFKGRKVAGVLGSNHVATLKKYDPEGAIAIKTYETRDGAVQDLLKGNVSGYINSRPVLLAEIRRGKLPFKLVGDPVGYEEAGFPFQKSAGGEMLRQRFSDGLERLRAEGALKKLSEKYFGEDITVRASG